MWQMPGHYRLGIVPNRKVIMDNIKLHEAQDEHNRKVVDIIQSIGSHMRQTDEIVEKHRKIMLFMLGIHFVTILIVLFEVVK